MLNIKIWLSHAMHEKYDDDDDDDSISSGVDLYSIPPLIRQICGWISGVVW